MMYRLLHFLFGWDYVHWRNSCDTGIARIRRDRNGNLFYWRYWNIKVADPIRQAEDFLWLTCPPEKYLPTEETKAVQGSDDDPTPWCHICGAGEQAQCRCGPIADND